jgi:hypothetical protein
MPAAIPLRAFCRQEANMSSWGAGGKCALWGKPPCPENGMLPYCEYDEQQGDWRCLHCEQWYGECHVRSIRHTKKVAWFQLQQGLAAAATEAPEPAATEAATSAPVSAIPLT